MEYGLISTQRQANLLRVVIRIEEYRAHEMLVSLLAASTQPREPAHP